MGKNTERNTHIEYDDFGEYEEVLEGWQAAVPDRQVNRRTQKMRNIVKKIVLITSVMTIILSETVFAATCGVNGCYRSKVYGGTYCNSHTCSKIGCKNFALDGGYCSSHRKKVYGSSSSQTKRCIVSGCHNSRNGSSCYCSSHKCRQSGCTNKAGSSGYCSRHNYKKSDPYYVYDYSDPEDFYFDWEDDFWDFEDAEDYWEDAWE